MPLQLTLLQLLLSRAVPLHWQPQVLRCVRKRCLTGVNLHRQALRQL